MMTFLYILLFVVFLSSLIMIHELGHLLTAKMFKVYCFEYAIGFGPKLLSFKRKNGETRFSLRAIPFGGFVSMYGESETLPEGLEVDPSRSLLAIKKWKRAIIMVAGVTMNFVLALVMFQIYEVAFPHYQTHYAHVSITEGSLASEKGLKNNDFLYSSFINAEEGSLVFYDDAAVIKYSDDTTEEAYFGFNYSNFTYKDASLTSLSVAYTSTVVNTITTDYDALTIASIKAGSFEADRVYTIKGYVIAMETVDNVHYFLMGDNFGEQEGVLFKIASFDGSANLFATMPIGAEVTVNGKVEQMTFKKDTITGVNFSNYKFRSISVAKGDLLSKKKSGATPKSISFNTYVVDESALSGRGKSTINFDLALTEKDGAYVLPNNLGMSMQIDKYYLSYGESVKATFNDFGTSSSLIFRTLGRMFYDSSVWNEMGGIIAVGVETTRTLKDYGFGDFIRIWAMISVNLGIVNLLPFPGLDGWQLLVVAVEGIFRKEIPQKVKTWFSIIGLALLFALMIVVVVKDVIRYVI